MRQDYTLIKISKQEAIFVFINRNETKRHHKNTHRQY